jgi:hypothetical protein
MDKNIFTYDYNKLTYNETYLTNIHGYTKEINGVLLYHGAYLLKSEFLRLSDLFPDIASMLTDVFSICLTRKEDNTLLIDQENINKVQENINKVNDNLKEIFEENTSIDYEGTVYNIIQDFGIILEDDGFDVETKLSFQNNLDELEKSLHYFLNKDLTSTIEKYNNNNTKNTTDPLIKQILFIHRRLEHFIKTLPSDVRLSISM